MASHTSSLPHARRIAQHLLLALLGWAGLGMGHKPVVSVRFYAEGQKLDGNSFSKPITFRHPTREGYIESMPSIYEKMIKAVYPFQAANGTWGCTFILDNSGRLNLEVVSTERRGSTLVAFVGTKTGTHQVVELQIDKPIRDGIISIPSGLTELEISAISSSWPVLGQQKKKKK